MHRHNKTECTERSSKMYNGLCLIFDDVCKTESHSNLFILHHHDHHNFRKTKFFPNNDDML